MRIDGTPRGIYRGRISRVTAEGKLYVEVPRYLRGHQYGPVQTLEGEPHITDILTDADGDPLHDHNLVPRPYIEGEQVLVAFVEDSPDDPVILGRLRGGNS